MIAHIGKARVKEGASRAGQPRLNMESLLVFKF
jgi:hypothetical protein